MTVRHIVLAAAAILVVGLGVKLFYEVKASPTETAAPAAPSDVTGPTATRPRSGGATSDTDRARDRLMGTVKDRGGIPAPADPVTPRKQKIGDDDIPPAALESSMLEANKAYDRQDYDEAKELANRLLAQDPSNVRMRRVLVSTACMQGDAAEAQKHFDLLPMTGDSRQVMRVRCKRDGNITFAEPTTTPGFQVPAKTQ